MVGLAAQGVILATVIGGMGICVQFRGCGRPSSPIIHTVNGAIRGYIAQSRDGRGFAAYVGIPYAKPPIGKLRFEAPEPAEPWGGVFEADTFAPDCFQYDAMVKGKYMGSEDCLYLNVFSPKQPNTDYSLPVLVWIHGGGFMSGGAKMYDPKYFMDEDVILVTMNYRLGPLGFLNTGDDKIRGNMGLKDQNLAMRWVKDNIANFGGDANKITIFGESAGAASVHYHLVSPASEGLFHKAILQSGAITCPWSFTNNPRRQALNYCKKVGCSTNNPDEMVRQLKQMSLKRLFAPMIDFMAEAPFTDQDVMFTPTIEAVQKDDTFLSENPRIALEEGRFNSVPIIMGMTSGEGALRTARIEASDKSLEEIDHNWNKYCPLVQMFDPKRTEVSEKIKQYYFSDKPFAASSHEFMQNFTKMMSDGWFFHAIHAAAKNHAKKAPVYLYFYDYRAHLPGIYSMMKAVKPSDWLFPEIKIAMAIIKDSIRRYFGFHGPHEYGVCHADDLLQMFPLEVFSIGPRSGDYTFSKAFVKSFADFAKNDDGLKFNGKPWPQTNAQSPEPYMYMRLDKDGQEIKEPFADRLPFWDSLNIRNWRAPMN